jgi:hypothetical protein
MCTLSQIIINGNLRQFERENVVDFDAHGQFCYIIALNLLSWRFQRYFGFNLKLQYVVCWICERLGVSA